MINVDQPETITREAYVALAVSAGFKTKDLISLEFRSDGIYAEVKAYDGDGKLLVDHAKHEVVTHRVYVRVQD